MSNPVFMFGITFFGFLYYVVTRSRKVSALSKDAGNRLTLPYLLIEYGAIAAMICGQCIAGFAVLTEFGNAMKPIPDKTPYHQVVLPSLFFAGLATAVVALALGFWILYRKR